MRFRRNAPSPGDNGAEEVLEMVAFQHEIHEPRREISDEPEGYLSRDQGFQGLRDARKQRQTLDCFRAGIHEPAAAYAECFSKTKGGRALLELAQSVGSSCTTGAENLSVPWTAITERPV